MGKDYYRTLDIPRNATQVDIRKAYRVLAIKFHPDKNKADNAAELFKEINEAYEVLSNEEERRIYDLHGEQGVKQGGVGTAPTGGFHFHRPEDIFKEFFGGEDPFASLFNDFFNQAIFGQRRRAYSSPFFDSPSYGNRQGDFFSDSRYNQPQVAETRPLYRDVQYNFGNNGTSGIKIRIYSRDEEQPAPQPAVRPQPKPQPTYTTQPTTRYYQQPEVIDLSQSSPQTFYSEIPPQGQGTRCCQCGSCHRFNWRRRSYVYSTTWVIR